MMRTNEALLRLQGAVNCKTLVWTALWSCALCVRTSCKKSVHTGTSVSVLFVKRDFCKTKSQVATQI